MRGINPGYLEKLDDEQKAFALSGPGNAFLENFVWRKGNHCFIIGTTGSGKTNKGYALVNWLKHSEKQIWMDSGKSDEILPLLCQGKRVNIIVPKYTDVHIEELIHGRWREIEDHPTVKHVSTAGDTWSAIEISRDISGHKVYDSIDILCYRNAFWTVGARARWMTEMFKTLSDSTRLRTLPAITPFSLHIDETQWAISGVRISRDEDRVRSSEIITENALEGRSAGERLIFYAQDYMNIPPAVRQNLVCSILCRGAHIGSEQDKRLSKHCTVPPWVKGPDRFSRNEGKYVNEEGNSSPTDRPWKWSLFPKNERDRAWIKRCRVRYEGYNDLKPETAELEEECFPELGRFQAMAIPPEKQGEIISRWGSEGVITDDN